MKNSNSKLNSKSKIRVGTLFDKTDSGCCFRLLYAFSMEKFYQLKVGFSNVEIAVITILMLKVVL